MTESNGLPQFSKVAHPVDGAVHVYQTDAPPGLPAWLGSSGSFVASTLVPSAPSKRPTSCAACMRLSFAGAAANADPTRALVAAKATRSARIFEADIGLLLFCR